MRIPPRLSEADMKMSLFLPKIFSSVFVFCTNVISLYTPNEIIAVELGTN